MPETGEMDPDSCQAHACTVAEVEVDDETGVVEVLAMYNVYEVGRALNPAMATQQIEGGAWMGISHALFEATEPYYPERDHGPADFSEYLMPGPADNAAMQSVILERPADERPVRRQGHRRDDRQRADPGDRQRDLRRLRRAPGVDAVHAREGPARARRAGGRADGRAALRDGRRLASRSWGGGSPSSATSPTRGCSPPSTSRSCSAGRSRWRASRGSARPRWPRCWPPCSGAS